MVKRIIKAFWKAIEDLSIAIDFLSFKLNILTAQINPVSSPKSARQSSFPPFFLYKLFSIAVIINLNYSFMAESWNKKEREQKKRKEKKDKADKMQQRKENGKSNADDMIAYMDENGNLSSKPPDPRKKMEIKLEDIQIGVPEYIPPTEAELTRTGKVTFFNEAKGFGFIKDIVSQQSVFVHVNSLLQLIKENDKVSFQTEMGQRGPVAINVKLIN